MFFPKIFLIGGTALLGTAGAIAGRIFSSNSKQEIELPETLGQLRARMERFKVSLKDGDVVTVADFPMPGETMVWLTPRDGGHWKNNFSSWNLIDRPYVKVKTVSELRKWCQIQKTITKVHIKKSSETSTDFKLGMSLDSNVTHSQLVQASDLNDIKYYCARPITNKEWFGKSFRKSKTIMAKPMLQGQQPRSCEFWMHKPYSKNNEDKLEPCWRISKEGDEVVDFGDE